MARQPEGRFVNEWLRTFHPAALQWKKVRLGPLPDKELARMYMVTQRWADAIFIENDTAYIVEGKLENQLAAVSQLELYGKLFKETPEFSAYLLFPIKLLLVVPFRDSDVALMCRERGIEYIVFTPAWYSRF